MKRENLHKYQSYAFCVDRNVYITSACCAASFVLGNNTIQGPVLLTLLRHVARILTNGSAAFFESCDAIGWNWCDVSQKRNISKYRGNSYGCITRHYQISAGSRSIDLVPDFSMMFHRRMSFNLNLSVNLTTHFRTLLILHNYGYQMCKRTITGSYLLIPNHLMIQLVKLQSDLCNLKITFRKKYFDYYWTNMHRRPLTDDCQRDWDLSWRGLTL